MEDKKPGIYCDQIMTKPEGTISNKRTIQPAGLWLNGPRVLYCIYCIAGDLGFWVSVIPCIHGIWIAI